MSRGQTQCRFCGAMPLHSVVDLGLSPLANSYPKQGLEKRATSFYPLEMSVCPKCFLAQVGEFETPEQIFGDYAYFSSWSKQWLDHCSHYVDEITTKLNLEKTSQVIEVASNDGYLLQFFKNKGIPVLGIEPAANVVGEALKKGIPSVCRFFGLETAKNIAQDQMKADLIIANNVLAHVPDLNDFVSGFKVLLKDSGTITIEVPHLLKLLQKNEFDTIYHEHFSYFSLFTAERVFLKHGMEVYDVDHLPTHGGALRLHIAHQGSRKISEKVLHAREEEQVFGISKLETYEKFKTSVEKVKNDFLSFLIECKRSGKKVAAYGAPAKGNTFLNYCGIKSDLISFTVDVSPHKYGKALPGTLIPIFHPDEVKKQKPDFLIILPWNIQEEITTQNRFISEWGGKFVRAIPQLEIF